MTFGCLVEHQDLTLTIVKIIEKKLLFFWIAHVLS